MKTPTNDQASTLRLIASNKNPVSTPDTSSQPPDEIGAVTNVKTRSLAISGGKGGVGKSNLAVNVALELGSLGNNVSLLDADFGLANADLLCGISSKYHLGHVIAGAKQLDEILVRVSPNVSILPSGSGIPELSKFSLAENSKILTQLKKMEHGLDFLLIDCAAGVGDSVTGVLVAADEVVIVATPEPTSIVDAYATIKVIARHAADKPISIVVNSVVGVGDAEKVYQQINQAVNRFLSRDVHFLGMIPSDTQVTNAVRDQTPLVRYAPETPASRAIRLIAKQIHSQTRPTSNPSESAKSFWDQLSSSDPV